MPIAPLIPRDTRPAPLTRQLMEEGHVLQDRDLQLAEGFLHLERSADEARIDDAVGEAVG